MNIQNRPYLCYTKKYVICYSCFLVGSNIASVCVWSDENHILSAVTLFSWIKLTSFILKLPGWSWIKLYVLWQRQVRSDCKKNQLTNEIVIQQQRSRQLVQFSNFLSLYRLSTCANRITWIHCAHLASW